MKDRLPGDHLPGDRVLTAPNALTALRLLAVPVVILLVLARQDVAAASVFVLAALTDLLDGALARRGGGTGVSRLGELLDPAADRLMLSGVALALAVRGLLPAPLVAVLVVRDALALLIGGLAFRGKIPVSRVGKWATAVLMASVALVVCGAVVDGADDGPRGAVEVAGEAAFYAGIGLSLAAGALYVGKATRRRLR